MTKSGNVSEKLALPQPTGWKEKFAVGLMSLFAGTPTYVNSFISPDNNLYPQEQSSLISTKEGEKVWIRKGYENFCTKMNDDDVVIRIISKSIATYSSLPLFGNRNIKKEHEITDENGRKLKKLELDDYFWLTYSTVGEHLEKISKYLINLGISEEDKIAIFADTHSDWLTMFLSILRIKCKAVTVYSTLSDDAIIYAINLTEATAVFVDDKSIQRLVPMLKNFTSVKHVICSTSCSPSLVESVKEHFTFPTGCEISSFDRESSVKPGRPSVKKIKKQRKLISQENKKSSPTKTSGDTDKEEVEKSEENIVPASQKKSSALSFRQSVSFDKEVVFGVDDSTCNNEEEDKPVLHSFVYILKTDVTAELPEMSSFKADDEVLVMFTSGSTGIPKGVILTNQNIVAAVAGGTHDRSMWVDIIFAGFLPLAHVFELVCELAVCFQGGCIGYCRPLTMFTGSPMLADNQIGDFPALGPVICPIVPLVLERLKKTIIEKVKDKGAVASSLLSYALDNKQYYLEKGMESTLVERIVFKKIREIIGSRLKYCICGGAPLSPLTEQFSYIVMGAKVKQGYGLTETCATGCIGAACDASFGNSGPPFPGIKFKLVDWTEGGYSTQDAPNPRGEVHLNGVSVSKGYYKMPDITEASFYTDPETNEIWFKTGDIAEYLPNGTFRIIDRKKDIVKLRNGEYVSLVAIEKAGAKSQYVENICALPNGEAEFITLIVSVSKVAVEKLAKELDVQFSEYSSVLENLQCSTRIYEDIREACKTEKLSKNEMPGKIHLASEVWLPDTGLVTPTMKVKRHEIAKFYASYL